MTSNICAHCVRRPATAVEEIDGRRINVCHECHHLTPLPEPPPPPTLRDRLLRAIRFNPGGSQWELMEFMGASDADADRIATLLRRLRIAGVVVAEGRIGARGYSLAKGGE